MRRARLGSGFTIIGWVGLLVLSACASPAAPPPTPLAARLMVTTTPAPPTVTPVPTPVPNTLFVDPAQQLGAINPLIFGSNIGPWTTVPLETRDEVAVAGLRLMRFPGGNWGDENNLTPKQIDEYIAQSREMGWEPMISVRLWQSTAQQAADLVRYVNIEKQYGVKYWSIGNEPSLYATSRRTPYTTDQFNRDWRTFAEAMRAVDPSITLLGPEIHQFDTNGGPQDAEGRFWMREFLRANGDLANVIAFHRYPFPTSRDQPSPSTDQLRANSQEWDRIIPYLRDLIRNETGRELPIAITEINANWTGAARGDATPDSHLGAIWWADVLTRLIRQRVDMVAHFAIHGPGRQGWGLVENFKVRPAYHVYPLYRMFGDEQVRASSPDALISIAAAQRDDGALTIMIVNLKAEAVTLPLDIAGSTATTAETWRLDVETRGEQIAPTDLQNRIALPAESVTLFVVPPPTN